VGVEEGGGRRTIWSFSAFHWTMVAGGDGIEAIALSDSGSHVARRENSTLCSSVSVKSNWTVDSVARARGDAGQVLIQFGSAMEERKRSRARDGFIKCGVGTGAGESGKVKVKVWHSAGARDDSTLTLNGCEYCETRGERQNCAHMGVRCGDEPSRVVCQAECAMFGDGMV
jgi:hypothetical protein